MKKVLVYKRFHNEMSLTQFVNDNDISQESIVNVVSSTSVYSSGGSDFHKNTNSEVWFTLFYYQKTQ
jgi:hypothetical protein